MAWLKKASASRSRFRRFLQPSFGIQSLDVVKFSKLVADSDIAREDADQIADELLLRVIVKFLADGMLSDQERTNLGAIACALEINSARLKRLEELAKNTKTRDTGREQSRIKMP